MKVRLLQSKRRNLNGNCWVRTDMVLTSNAGRSRRISLSTRLAVAHAHPMIFGDF